MYISFLLNIYTLGILFKVHNTNYALNVTSESFSSMHVCVYQTLYRSSLRWLVATMLACPLWWKMCWIWRNLVVRCKCFQCSCQSSECNELCAWYLYHNVMVCMLGRSIANIYHPRPTYGTIRVYAYSIQRIYTSRDSLRSASFHWWRTVGGIPTASFLRWHFHNSDSGDYHDAGTVDASSHCF